MIAVIFSSAADRHGARACAIRLRSQGWQAWVAIDSADGPAEDGEIITEFPRNGNLNGSLCMVGIFSTLLEMATGKDTVMMKIDADVWLSDAGSQWLAETTEERARGFTIGKSSRWIGGAWAARRRQIMAAMDAVATGNQCAGCAESSLSLAAFRASGGVTKARPEDVQVWRAGRTIRPDAMLVTLPSRITASDRFAEILDLFSLPKPILD